MDVYTERAIVSEFLDDAEAVIKQRPFYMRIGHTPRLSSIRWLRELNEAPYTYSPK